MSDKTVLESLDALGIFNAPREEDRLRHALANPNQFANWFPAVVNSGVRHPQTEIVVLPWHVTRLVMHEDPVVFGDDLKVAELVSQISALFDAWGVDSLFMKNSLFSAKHGWGNTCYLSRGSDIARQLMELQYQWLCCSPDSATHLVLRKMINSPTLFRAFNKMPITQEFRLFVEPSGVYAYQPYWPAKAIQQPDSEDWEAKLAAVSVPSASLLHEMIVMANKVMLALPADYQQAWSVDFLIDEDGAPWLIDMALARHSYVSPERTLLPENNACVM